MQNFDFNEALKAIQSGKPITGSDGVFTPDAMSVNILLHPASFKASN